MTSEQHEEYITEHSRVITAFRKSASDYHS